RGQECGQGRRCARKGCCEGGNRARTPARAGDAARASCCARSCGCRKDSAARSGRARARRAARRNQAAALAGMAEASTIARPYAEAVFKLADAEGKLAEWSGVLANIAAVAADERIRVAVGDPNLSAAKIAGLFISVLSGKLSGDAENLVRVLAENGRLDVLAEIRTQYEALRNEREGVVEAEVHTAFDLEDAQLADLVARLEKKT